MGRGRVIDNRQAGVCPGALPRLRQLALVLVEFQHELAIPIIPASLVRACPTPFARAAGRPGTLAP
jgi:hypothetical protein